MLPRLDSEPGISPTYRHFLEALRASSYAGEIRRDYASRLVQATDNSVYQLLPAAVLFPQNADDIAQIARLAAGPRFHSVCLSPRGGGTGTNGQSLTRGIVVDTSKHMNQILELNAAEGWVRVQPGVVLDQLNRYLAPHGLFFAPTLSPSNRATIGGMISTDACGKGSRIYGKTSQHVLELGVVLTDGTAWTTHPVSTEELEELKSRPDRLGAAVRVVDEVATQKAALIAKQFPKLPRHLTGYDLAHVRREDGRFDLSAIIAGSEGTLTWITEAKLKVLPIPKVKRLVAIRYATFDDALADAELLVRTNPGAIETIDERILTLARSDIIWHSVGHLLVDAEGQHTRALNLVEFEGNDREAVEAQANALTCALDAERGKPGHAIGFAAVFDPIDAKALWELRKKGVGLLASLPGKRRPVAFVEDTAVPPERLAEYTKAFRRLLDDAGVEYGMFGHVDVGCLHVRPALDLKNPADARLLRDISDRVVELVKSYGGLMWAEHGKGFRSEYSPVFFGEELFGDLCRIKAAFDPHNQLNPGKLAAPSGRVQDLVNVDDDKRGQFDGQIPERSLDRYAMSVNCNGNGACFNYDADSVMCPSSKATRDRIHSPKGRAVMMREWLRLLGAKGQDAAHEIEHTETRIDDLVVGAMSRAAGEYDFSHEVYEAMDGCLACKACATQCPVKVDVPQLKSEFLQLYHRRYLRPIRDYFVAALEFVVGWMALLPRLFNWIVSLRWFELVMRKVIGIVDTPLLSELTVERGLEKRDALPFDWHYLESLSEKERSRSVLIVQDAFTTYYDAEVVLALYDFLSRLGFSPTLLPIRANGKALHVKGFLAAFRRTAARNADFLQRAAALGMPLVGVDPAVTLTYRDEYPHALGAERPVEIMLLQEWLASERQTLSELLELAGYEPPEEREYTLMPHCTEQTAAPASQTQWKRVFATFGLELRTPSAGCCGMCGMFGHEAHHRDESRAIYESSWKQQLPSDPEARRRTLTAGYSCRSQVKRFDGDRLRHPVEVLAELTRDLEPKPWSKRRTEPSSAAAPANG